MKQKAIEIGAKDFNRQFTEEESQIENAKVLNLIGNQGNAK